MGGSLLYFKHPINRIGIEGIGPQPIQTAGWKSNNTDLFNEVDGPLNYFGLGMFRV